MSASSERGDIPTDIKELQWIIRDNQEQIYFKGEQLFRQIQAINNKQEGGRKMINNNEEVN